MHQKPFPATAVPPPVVFLGAAFAALGINVIWPLPLPLDPRLGDALGVAAVLASAGLGFWGIRAMFQTGESPDPSAPTRRLVTGGPFAYSRNPLYLSLALFEVGLGLLFDNLWLFILLLPAFLYVDRLIVGREEAYLEGRLGEEYREYKRRVRRWL